MSNGIKNYITLKGLEKLKEELRHLRDVERPEVVKTVSWAASNGDRSENADYIYGKRRLREIDKRIEFLVRRLDSSVVVNPLEQKSDKVLFGATVTIRDEEERTRTYHIVGADEIDLNHNKISWVSPLAKALLQKKIGDYAIVKTPRGEDEVEIINIDYIDIP